MNKNFKIGFEKTAKISKSQGVAAVAIINKDGKILMGLRRDIKKWTNPGGHIEDGESPLAGAQREVKEETGVDIAKSKFSSLGKGVAVTDGEGRKLTIYPFKVSYNGPISGSKDPDEEINRWRWCSMNELEDDVKKNLHVPKKNVLFDALGISY